MGEVNEKRCFNYVNIFLTFERKFCAVSEISYIGNNSSERYIIRLTSSILKVVKKKLIRQK